MAGREYTKLSVHYALQLHAMRGSIRGFVLNPEIPHVVCTVTLYRGSTIECKSWREAYALVCGLASASQWAKDTAGTEATPNAIRTPSKR